MQSIQTARKVLADAQRRTTGSTSATASRLRRAGSTSSLKPKPRQELEARAATIASTTKATRRLSLPGSLEHLAQTLGSGGGDSGGGGGANVDVERVLLTARKAVGERGSSKAAAFRASLLQSVLLSPRPGSSGSVGSGSIGSRSGSGSVTGGGDRGQSRTPPRGHHDGAAVGVGVGVGGDGDGGGNDGSGGSGKHARRPRPPPRQPHQQHRSPARYGRDVSAAGEGGDAVGRPPRPMRRSGSRRGLDDALRFSRTLADDAGPEKENEGQPAPAGRKQDRCGVDGDAAGEGDATAAGGSPAASGAIRRPLAGVVDAATNTDGGGRVVYARSYVGGVDKSEGGDSKRGEGDAASDSKASGDEGTGGVPSTTTTAPLPPRPTTASRGTSGDGDGDGGERTLATASGRRLSMVESQARFEAARAAGLIGDEAKVAAAAERHAAAGDGDDGDDDGDGDDDNAATEGKRGIQVPLLSLDAQSQQLEWGGGARVLGGDTAQEALVSPRYVSARRAERKRRPSVTDRRGGFRGFRIPTKARAKLAVEGGPGNLLG